MFFSTWVTSGVVECHSVDQHAVVLYHNSYNLLLPFPASHDQWNTTKHHMTHGPLVHTMNTLSACDVYDSMMLTMMISGGATVIFADITEDNSEEYEIK